MKTIFLLLFAPLLAGTALAEAEQSKSLLPYVVTEKGIDKTLRKSEAAFDFIFCDRHDNRLVKPVTLAYNNGKNIKTPGNTSGTYSLRLKPGSYVFQFWYDSLHIEVKTRDIKIEGGTRTEIKVFFDRSDEILIQDKPVIYLYPQEKTRVNVTLALQGNLLFTYPAYQNGWQVTAYPDGTLEQNGSVFGYLFWEAQAPLAPGTLPAGGFVKTTAELTAFFEEKLQQLGLSSSEIQDFVTYWVPRMQAYDKHLVRFVLNQDFDRTARLVVDPQPDCTIRVFMVWTPLEKNDEPQITPQELPTLQRHGFTVIEWGGTMMKNAITQE